jgi:hypothetical protein
VRDVASSFMTVASSSICDCASSFHDGGRGALFVTIERRFMLQGFGKNRNFCFFFLKNIILNQFFLYDYSFL